MPALYPYSKIANKKLVIRLCEIIGIKGYYIDKKNNSRRWKKDTNDFGRACFIQMWFFPDSTRPKKANQMLEVCQDAYWE